MTGESASERWFPMVRLPDADDIARLQAIEASADELVPFSVHPEWPQAAPGQTRLAAPGLLFDIGEPAVGFVHVLDLGEGHWHLEQLSVARDQAGQGMGRALLRAAIAVASGLGGSEMTLMTFADLPFNAPFYATEGFLPVTDTREGLRGFVEAEARLGMSRWGPRVAMSRVLGAESSSELSSDNNLV